MSKKTVVSVLMHPPKSDALLIEVIALRNVQPWSSSNPESTMSVAALILLKLILNKQIKDSVNRSLFMFDFLCCLNNIRLVPL